MEEKGNKTPRRGRYWSIMLVGDQGRVIPFRHFKALAVGIGLVLAVSLSALVVLGLLYGHQRQQLGTLQQSLEETRAQTTKLRDEKDLCLTQLVTVKHQTGEPLQGPAMTGGTMQGNGQAAVKPGKKEEAPEVKQEAPVKKPEPQVKWSADIRNFRAIYDNRQQILKTEFRIYNTSAPRNALTGRAVVVFKAKEDPPIQWAVVPPVPLGDGKPVGNNGKAFRINNYRTENFSTIRRNNSAAYDTASIYIFTEQGDLIANKEIAFHVDYSPPKTSMPVKPKSEEGPEKSSKSAHEQIETVPPRPDEQAIDRTPQNTSGPPSSPQVAPPSPLPSPAPQGPSMIQDRNPQATDKPLNTETAIEPDQSESTIPTPAAEEEPALKGGQK